MEKTRTFTVEGKEFAYPLLGYEDEASRAEFRSIIAENERQGKTKYELKHLPLKEKTRRYFKNFGLEALAMTLEGFCAPFQLGGLTIRFDGIRDKKESTYMNYRSMIKETNLALYGTRLAK